MSLDGLANGPTTTIHEWFERQAAARGEAVAVVGEHLGEYHSLSYRELDRRANRIARHLRGLGVRAETPIAVCLRRTPLLVTALLAVLKAGGAYVPLDPASPDERLEFTVADAGAVVLLSDTPDRRLGACQVVDLSADGADLSGYPNTAPGDGGVRPEHLAYVIYTSGSTGVPKGVMVEHRNVTGLLESTQDRFGFGPTDVWPLFASAAFDLSVWEMWGALLHGGTLVVVSEEVRRAPEEFHALLRREQVTVLTQTPAAFRQLIQIDQDTGPADGLALRLVIFGGEVLPLDSLRPWFARHGDERPELINMYGITETTVHSTFRRITATDLETAPGSVIGGPLTGWSMQVLAEDGREVACGQAGELYVGGVGVARGYLGRPGLTAQHFLPDPDASVPGARRYRSGDTVRRLSDGDHIYLGRLDHQVQVRGYRVELGEIEIALARHPCLVEAVVVMDTDAAGGARLVAYCVGRAAPRPGAAELRAHLQCSLPDYMLPSVYVVLNALPLTPNGKVDRRALPPAEAAHAASAIEFVAPVTPLEKAVAEIWADTLSLERVGLDDDFFVLGGQSMLAAQVAAAVRERLGVRATLRLLFDQPTVREFAGAIESTERDPS